jgi:hypothetical protein
VWADHFPGRIYHGLFATSPTQLNRSGGLININMSVKSGQPIVSSKVIFLTALLQPLEHKGVYRAVLDCQYQAGHPAILLLNLNHVNNSSEDFSVSEHDVFVRIQSG